MKLQIARLPVPELEFGGAGYFQDPRLGLMQAGPFDMRFGVAHKLQVRVCVVSPSEMHSTIATWLLRCRMEISPERASSTQPMFPGFASIFRSELVADIGWYLAINPLNMMVSSLI